MIGRHIYCRVGKFKNVNAPYAIVNGIVFKSIYEAESYCQELGLDPNISIESDDPRALAKCRDVALKSIPILKELIRRQESVLHENQEDVDRLWREYGVCVEREKAYPNISTRVDRELASERAVAAGNKLDGCLHTLAVVSKYLYDLECIVRLKEEK